MTVAVRGADRLARGLRDVARLLKDLSGEHREAGQQVAATAGSRAPRLTGRLAGSVRVTEATPTGATIGSSLPYARVIHDGWPAHGIRSTPFLTDKLDDSERVITPIYRDAIQDALDDVKGA